MPTIAEFPLRRDALPALHRMIRAEPTIAPPTITTSCFGIPRS